MKLYSCQTHPDYLHDESRMSGSADLICLPESEADVLKLLGLTNAVHTEWPDRLFVSMSMGGIGSISRICGEVFGSCITFGSVGQASAPGQIEAQKLAQVLDLIHDSLQR